MTSLSFVTVGGQGEDLTPIPLPLAPCPGIRTLHTVVNLLPGSLAMICA